jgi:hypothetical protein
MNDAAAAEIGAWLTQAGLADLPEPNLLHGFCRWSVRS